MSSENKDSLWELPVSGMDSALVVGLSCRVGCSTRADQGRCSQQPEAHSCNQPNLGLIAEGVLHWWWDSPAVWAAVPGLTSGCSQQPEAHSCNQPNLGLIAEGVFKA
ncbi:unnamed protein product [Staurois parvus]|uniref:Uncharacterized protein n=1 Tax=Staurois parvus TaxID=386267 RepID=A0ABN9CVI0_9NEOB|nr:unnamed protein product [Staurois parvus]